MQKTPQTSKTQETPKTDPLMKAKSVGWLLGQALVFCLKIIKLGDNPVTPELRNEAKGLLQRWETERKI